MYDVYLHIWQEAYMNQETLNQRVHFQLQKAGLSQHSIVPDLPRLPESIATFSDTNVLYNSHVSGRGSYLPQQHKNNCMCKLDCDFFPNFDSCAILLLINVLLYLFNILLLQWRRIMSV
jgi:hypothetical protein